MRYRGVLTVWFDRGFGFIASEDRKEQFFLHVSGISEGPVLPEKGSTVEFEVGEPYKKGKLPQAIKAVISPAKASK